MASIPSIKGSVFASVVEDVRKVASSGALSRQELSRWLDARDVALLDEPISISSWYDIESYRRMNELLRDVAGGGSNEYLILKGRETARRLLEAGLYAQLEYLHRTRVAQVSDETARFDAFGRDLRRLTTISASILNFSRWSSRPDPEHPGRYLIEVAEAERFPEVLCWRSWGFVNEMATEHGEPDLWRWERKTPERILFSMIRPV
jgi:hypothetical protein